MGSRTLAPDVNVHIPDAAGEVHSFLAGTEVPEWAANKLGPHCFDDYDGKAEPVSPDAAKATAARDKAQKAIAEANVKIAAALRAGSPSDAPSVASTDETKQDTEEAADEDGPPPLGGPGSGHDAWAAYAESLGLEPGDKGRDEIVAMIDSAGYPTTS